MDARRWDRIKEVFSLAIARGPQGTEQALLEDCHGDEELFKQVRPLIDEHFLLLSTARTHPSADTPQFNQPAIIADRYHVISRLGSGSFGDVYRVRDDKSSGGELALKILRSSDPRALQHFKREFRSLADIYHPNIIRLHELLAHGDQWLFTMEVVDGVDFVKYVRLDAPEERNARLRSCLYQLAEGIRALHSRKLLHRDLKPSNVLVTANGRLVILDFGLVRSFDDGAQSLVTFAGTPDYMSPEQAAGRIASEASDWYAVGVILYQSLTGSRPFSGNFVEVLHRKQLERARSPLEIAPDTPKDLNILCLRLLEPDPARRAKYDDVIRVTDPNAQSSKPRPAEPAIVGRTEPLRRLTSAVYSTDDRPRVIHLCGPSGIGKTALLREFITHLRQDPKILVVTGRCYEGEAIPYQALDDLIDHVGQYFRRLPADHVERLLPRNFSVLVRMFPVLAPFLSPDIRPVAALTSVEMRTRAIGALRELFGRLCERHRIVLVIDDLQWGDADGCAALNELFSSSDSPPVLAILAYRSEDIDAIASLGVLRATATEPAISLDQFDRDECRQLVETMLDGNMSEDTFRRVFEQSEGNPFLIHEIVQWLNEREGEPVLKEQFSLTDVIRSRMEQLSSTTRHFLELVAVAGQPTELATLQLAGGLGDSFFTRDELISQRLLRSRIVRGREEVEIYHDRIRETILSCVSDPAHAQRHLQLARAFEAAGGQDPARIAAHYDQAKDPLAAKYALLAGRRAAEMLAFHEAARFFEMALSTDAIDSAVRRTAHRDCGDALADAGLGLRAAEHYLAACHGGSPDEQLEWSLRAAEELLYSGHIDRGLDALQSVLRRVGLKLPSTGVRLPSEVLFNRLKLKLRGLGWQERAASHVERKTLIRIDTCSSAAKGLALVDVIRGSALQSDALLLALNAGEPSRIARSLALEAGYRSTEGVKARKVADALLQRAKELSDRTGDLRAIGMASVMKAGCAWGMGDWQECYDAAREAEELLRDHHERLTWERDTAAIFRMDGLRWLGGWAEIKRSLPTIIEDARSRGDLYIESILQMQCGACGELANDNPEAALSCLRILERWSNTGFHVEHLIEVHNQVEIALYSGKAREALDIVSERWAPLKKSFLLRVQTFNIHMRSLLARAALGAASQEGNPLTMTSLLKVVEREAKMIGQEGAVWSTALAELLLSGFDSLNGQISTAITRLERAEKLFISERMALHVAASRRCRGLLLGGETGRQLVSDADTAIRAEGIAVPERITAVISPGRFSG